MTELSTQQIGRCGELLVQYWLLKHGVESAALTTDTGIDLVAPKGKQVVTIQVKTSSQGGPAGDKWLLWEIPEDCPADYIAAVDLKRNKFWLMPTDEFKQISPRGGKGQKRLWWPLPEYEYKRAKRKEGQFKDYEMDVAIPKVFGLDSPAR
ncbi:MAG: hypothetical protein AB1793_09415 [Candidatus Thermoplasmatota archaeon]